VERVCGSVEIEMRLERGEYDEQRTERKWQDYGISNTP
jgi:hypothetical protein